MASAVMISAGATCCLQLLITYQLQEHGFQLLHPAPANTNTPRCFHVTGAACRPGLVRIDKQLRANHRQLGVVCSLSPFLLIDSFNRSPE